VKNKSYPYYESHVITDLKDLLSQSVEQHRDKPAFWVKSGKNEPYAPISYLKFGRDVRELGSALLMLGMANKKVAIIGENRYEWAASYMAAAICSEMVVPIDRELPQNDVHSLFNAAEVGCVIYSAKLGDCVRAWNKTQKEPVILINMDIDEDTETEYSIKRVKEKGGALLDSGDSSFDDVVIDPAAPKILLFTSGTTSTPKGVLLSHGNLAANLTNMCKMIAIRLDDIFLSVLPLHHTYECTCGFLCPIYRGASVAYGEGLKQVLSNLKESSATVMLAVPALFETMYRRVWANARKTGKDSKLKTGLKISRLAMRFGIDVRRKLFAELHAMLGGKLRLFISGAAAADPEVSKGFRELGINFLQGYGITECSPIVAVNRDFCYKDNAAGLILPNMDVKLVNKDENGIGEIVCRGGNVMLGYYNNEEATAAAFDDGWFKTGDLAIIDDDGFVIITGREKNVIVTSNGKNIYPEELEYLVSKHLEVSECMVYGEKSEKDQELQICIQVLPDLEYIQEVHGEKTPDEIKKMIEGFISDINKANPLYKYIRNVYLREDEFVKTTTRKIKRYAQTPQQQE